MQSRVIYVNQLVDKSIDDVKAAATASVKECQFIPIRSGIPDIDDSKPNDYRNNMPHTQSRLVSRNIPAFLCIVALLIYLYAAVYNVDSMIPAHDLMKLHLCLTWC